MKDKTTQRLCNKKLLSFPKYESIKYWRRRSNVNNNISMQYVNQSELLSWLFSDLSRGKWYLQRKYMSAQHETLHCRNCTNSYQTRVNVTEVVKDMCDNWMVFFDKFLARGWHLFFNWYLRLGKFFFTF
jgi:hypothetical protein